MDVEFSYYNLTLKELGDAGVGLEWIEVQGVRCGARTGCSAAGEECTRAPRLPSPPPAPLPCLQFGIGGGTSVNGDMPATIAEEVDGGVPAAALCHPLPCSGCVPAAL